MNCIDVSTDRQSERFKTCGRTVLMQIGIINTINCKESSPNLAARTTKIKAAFIMFVNDICVCITYMQICMKLDQDRSERANITYKLYKKVKWTAVLISNMRHKEQPIPRSNDKLIFNLHKNELIYFFIMEGYIASKRLQIFCITLITGVIDQRCNDVRIEARNGDPTKKIDLSWGGIAVAT